jgi:DNA polymerase-3 subunit epsilon
MSTWGERLGVFDLETTGVDVDTSRIVSACIAVLDESGAVMSRWNWLADPGIDIPEGASAVHGITTERARDEGRDAKLVVAEITQTLRVLLSAGIPVTVYNAPYDLSLLDRECRRHGLEPLVSPTPIIDPLVMDKSVDRYRKGKRTLEVTAELYEVSLDDAHDAGADAIAAGRVAQALLRRYPDDLDIGLTELHSRQKVWHAEQAASFQEYLRSKRGDDTYIADPSWPLKPAADTSSFVDTQPIPPLPPRPGQVPILDFSATGVLALETSRGESEPAAPRFNSEAYRRAPRPSVNQRVEADPEDPFVQGDDDSEPAWIIEPSETPMITIAESLGAAAEAPEPEASAGIEPTEPEPEPEPTEPEPEPAEPEPADEPESTEPEPIIEYTRAEYTEIQYTPADFEREPDDLSGAWSLDDDDAPDEDVPEAPVPDPSLPDLDASGDQLIDPEDHDSNAEPLAASDAIGEPESEPAAPTGPPPAVLRIAAAIITDPDGRCLLVRKSGSTNFMQAGGKLDPGESALDALTRELQEELGLVLDESTAEYLGVFRADAANEPNTVVSAAVFALETAEHLEPRGEIEELLWIDSVDGITVDLAPLTRDQLLSIWESRRAGSTLF